ncbi:MAG: hypothetical protein JWQ66_1196 [Mucilaginibacter sp.]|nr:hypothetical protein [Mucilaginibacter sp.]
MKKIFLFGAAILIGCLSFKSANAQLHVNVGINIGSQPEWGPVGYDRADYYYMPDIDAYYDVNAHQYVYSNNNVWIHSASLPPRYSNYDVYHGYKVVVNERTPWVHNDVYRTKYSSYRGQHNQSVIRDSHDSKYRNHWKGDNDKRQSHGKDHDNGRDHRN